MKRLLTVVFVMFCLLGFAACDPQQNTIDGEVLLSKTTKIELVYYENKNPKSVRVDGWRKPRFDFSKVTPIATLDEALIETVVKDVAEGGYNYWGRAANEPIGKTMIMYQSDGNMLVLYGCAYKEEKGGTRYYGECCVFDANGVFVEYIGDVGHTYVESLEAEYFKSDTE